MTKEQLSTFLKNAGFLYNLCNTCNGSGLDYWGERKCESCKGQKYTWKCPKITNKVKND